MEHELKCWPEYFQAVKSDAKPFEVRKFDRPYAVGDILRLREYDPKTGNYTGDEIKREISYLLDLTYLRRTDRPIYGGYVVLGLRRPDSDELTPAEVADLSKAIEEERLIVFESADRRKKVAEIMKAQQEGRLVGMNGPH